MNVYSKFTDMFKHNIKGMYILRSIFLLLTLMTLGATSAMAQTFEPGLYFIASRDYVPANTTTNFYLCPTKSWAYYQSSSPYYTTDSDNGMPFMTTYRCRDGEYDALNAIWSIERIGETNYYYIKHVSDGKYLTYNRKMADGNEGRMRLHLETSPTDDDAAQFQINYVEGSSCYEIITKKENSRKYVNVTGPSGGNGNINELVGTNARSDGPSGCKDVGGIIGLWTAGVSDNNSKWYFEDASSFVCATPTITYNESTQEVSISTTTDGATIYYTTDGSTPTSSSTRYTVPFTVSNTTNIQAIAVKDGMLNSAVGSKQVVKYTYKVVNIAKNIAAEYTIPYPVSVGTPLTGYTSIPEEIRSPYISDETITFKSFDGPFSPEALDAADAITETSTTSNIYITYTTDKLDEKFLHLQGVRPFNLKNSSGQYLVNSSSSSTILTYDEVNTETTPKPQNKNKDHLWYISGGDPYAVTIKSPETGNYLTSSSVSNTPNTFILTSEVPIPLEERATVTFRDASGSVAVTINEVKIPTSYYLIDKAGRRILGPAESTSSVMAIPDEWRSPLAEYHYWKSSSFDETAGVYKLKDGQEEIHGLEDLGTGDHIYITYDVKNTIDIRGGKTYLMRFSDGASFKQENGLDAVYGSASKAIYPYNNGDHNLYIYGLNPETGADRFEEQLSSGASTRSRWLWYIISNHDGADLMGDNADPYHVIIKSRQNQSYKVGDDTYNGNAYLRTFKPNDEVGVVTGVITQHDVIKAQDPTLKPTEYMLLGADINHLVLKTLEAIDGDQQTVNKFEQYWKNNPTALNILNAAGQGVVGEHDVTYELSDDQKAVLTALGWHTYESWAYAAPWSDTSTGGKTLRKGNHWFQTVSMGSGEFSVEDVVLEPQVILLDQHGWEVMRVPMSQKDKLKKYDSPMVEQYQWYPSASKVSGYHKYTVSSQSIVVYDANGDPTEGRYTHNSTSLADIPYDHAPIDNQVDKVKTDFYVTYTVKSDYAGAYAGAATEGGVKASSYFVKQADKYAQNSSNTIALVDKPSLTGDIPTNVQWKVKPNFNIDREMGYRYDGEPGAYPEALSREDTEAAYYAAGKNGFDPYNVQIQSVSSTSRYFTANSASATLNHGVWTGTGSTTISLTEKSSHISAIGHDQTVLDITKATFMVVDDGNGNMRLMPRFDNTKVMTSFTDLSEQQAAAPVNDDGKGTQSLVIELVPIVITSTDEILSMKGYYVLAENFTQTKSLGTSDAPFEGTIDGQLNHFDFTMPLVKYANNAIIRNIILNGVSLTEGNDEDHLGAIACTATGETRIYNCGVDGGSLSESAHVGGIVGHLDGNAHVVNCYSYANITGGTDKGGIVGYNNIASTAGNLQTMVMNCAFYGDITGSGAPVYGGQNIANLNSGGLNTFNYYAYQKLPTDHISTYNSALAIDDKYLKRFEFYRLLLNSNKKLAAYYASTSTNPVQPGDMAKWVLETADRSIDSPKEYPVLKARGYYPSIINYDVENAPTVTLDANGRPIEADRNKGGKLGKQLRVHLSGTGITTTLLTIDRTDKDFERYNYNYDKIQLPYFNDVGEGNYTDYQVVTGWEIVSMTGGTPGSYSETDAYGGYNFADRKCTQKDINSVSHRVFSQGAYFDVPYGVTDIYIQPHWATAAYVADEYLDVVYNTSYGAQSVTQLGKQFLTGKITINGSEQTVHKSISDALKNKSSETVYDLAIVLVGNLHQSDVPSKGTVPFTVMSADLDHDNEPDYSMIYHHTGRTVISPIRFDFLNIPGTAQAQKPNGTNSIRNFTIFKTKGWFETTNTCLVYSNQVEYENKDGVGTKDLSPLILQGGDFEQFVSTQSQSVDGRTIYIHVGGNVHIQSFGLGTHSDGSQSTPHIPVSVTGGEYDGFYLTGTYNANAKVRKDDAECYISGGYFKEAAGASLEQIDGSVHWQIYNADIDAFFGGGINEAKPITGDVTTDIYNSYVTLFCGGPKFGNMQGDKKVTTNAEGCVFGKFFGAGYGGTSIARKKYYDNSGSQNWGTLQGYYINDKGKYFDGQTTQSSQTAGKDYGRKGLGVATDFEYEFFVWSTGATGARLFVDFASFSLAQCNDVNSKLKGCTINQDFYGGGSLGKVVGKATSELDGCTVLGNVFGGGYSASLPTIQVRDGGFTTNPNYNSNTGMFEPGVFTGTTEFTWKNAAEAGKTLTNGQSGSDLENHYVYTNADLTALGQVGETDLTIKGNTSVAGNVFGGGDESAISASATATGNTKVTIEENDNNETPTVSNVYGGGNTADVDGSTKVDMTNGTVSQDIYGGGKGQTTVVGGNVEVNIGPKKNDEKPLSVHDVYGGSALGVVNTTQNTETGKYEKTTTVNVYGGTVTGSVFGGGLGQVAAAAVAADPEHGIEAQEAKEAIVAKNFGATTVNMEGGAVKTAVYGGANVNGVLKGGANVNVLGGTVRTAPASTPASASDIKNAVFGGGYGEPTIVEGDIAVTIGTQAATPDNSKPTVYGSVYGGSALGKVQVSEDTGDDQLDKKIDVNLYGGTIHGNVFGGGLGQKASAEPVQPDVEAEVGGNVNVLLDGAKFIQYFIGEDDNRMPLTAQIFGANNLNGTPKGHVKVHVKRTVDSAKDTGVDRDARTTYDVAAVYGGGNQADYIPTDALLDPAVEGNPEKIAAATAEVLIEGCDKTSIEYVYGGGNAAAVPATDVTVLGDYIIDYLFGGGNGKSTATFTNPGANVGSYNNGASNYGTGKAVTKLVGCHIHCVFGGSNTKGNVRGGTSVSMPEATPYPAPTFDCCTVRDVKEIYGAGNEAEQDGAVTMILGCVDNMDYVYGGARNAHVKGGVDLVVTSGHFKGVYGGNDTSGSIQGPITVTIEETGCDPLIIDNLYLGGKDAAYSVYGYKNTGTPEEPVLVARTKAEYEALTPEQKTAEGLPYDAPVLNIVSCTRIGKESGEDLGGAFGGGYGVGATLHGNPTVNVNMIAGKYAAKIDRDETPGADNDATALGIVRNVYGGGEQANVEGNTKVNIGTETTVTVRTSMGAPVVNEPTAVLGALITDNVFGAGKGSTENVESALVSGNTEVNICTADYSAVAGFKGISIAKSVYGGGQLSQVVGTTNITVSGGTIGTSGQGGATYGNIYGGGFGNNDNVRFGLVKGNTNVTVTGGSVLHSVYGGGAYGSVGTYTYASEAANAAISALATENTGKATIRILGGTIGTDGHENGMIFGSSRGDIAAPGAIQDNMAWVYDTEVVIGIENDETPGPRIHGSLYGSGENGHTFRNASVTMYSGTIGNPEEFYSYRGNVYGGGCDTDKYYSTGTETHDGHGDKYNPMAGIVKGNATVNILGGSVANNIYGAGAMGKVEGNTSVTINTKGSVGVDGNHDDGNVYGAARGELGLSNDYASVTNSSVTLTKGTVKGSVYGGGRAGVVIGQVAVQLNGGAVKHDVYGGGALAQTNTGYDAGSEPANTYTTTVNLAGTTVDGNLYGGGLGQLASAGTAAVLYANVGEYNAAKGTSLTAEQFAALSEAEKTKTPAVAAQEAVAANVNGPVTVSVTNGSAANVFGCNNLNGAPQTTVDVEIGAKSGSTLSGSATVSGSVYGGGNMAAYAGSPAVKIYGGTVNTNVYGGGLGETAVTGGTSVTLEGGKVDNDVYGGGSQADVTGSVAVTVTGGTVTHDVYGGGALANTNTANWNTSGSAIEYVEVTPAPIVGTTPVGGYYTRSGSAPNFVYTLVPSGSAIAEKTYYKKQVVGGWAASHPHTTTMVLTGGVIGNAYGGGLGSSSVAANVYGDVKVTVNKPAEVSSTGASGIAFTRNTVNVTYGEGDKRKEYIIPVTGRVFGCNNINGTPTGNVRVEVYATRQIEINGPDNYTLYPISGEHSPNGHNRYYEVQAVYGGGNLSDYLPATGSATSVYIGECDVTSIEKVYGGGNSAVVPSSEVVINGSFDIGTAFGGGNGGDLVQREGVWYENDGAIVIGTALMKPKGGKVGEVFGGSDAKGFCGNPVIDKTESNPYCKLITTRMYGAGKESDVDHVDVVISGCTAENTEIEYVFGGSYNAHIANYINLTISAGVFKNVFGGNDRTGSIGGDITVNIEETEDCAKPLIIQNLFGGGNEAAYPGTRRDGTEIATPGKITVNVKSATRIDNVFGGSFKADVNGDTEVNINMTKGFWAGKTYQGKVIPDSVGAIGNVYGGGNQGVVRGSSTVNIATATTVGYVTEPVHLRPNPAEELPKTDGLYFVPVTGARITGDVFGGGSEANVNGNATVNICTADFRGSANFQGALISRGSVYGGGSAGDVLGNTSVTMSGGNRTEVDGAYVFDGVYGGGLMGSVGTAADGEGNVVYHTGAEAHAGCIGKIVNYKANTGKCTVVVTGGQVGPKEVALADGGMKNTARYFKDPKDPKDVGPVDVGFVFGAGRGEVEDPATDKDADFRTFVKETDVTVGGTAFIMASVYGGGENGRVANDTHVTIEGDCQIGCGEGKVEDGKPVRYTTTQWTGENASNFTECASWDFKSPYWPYDPYGGDDAGLEGTDGHTYYGNVFGGGSGYFPYKKADGTHEWLRSAGTVYGNTVIDITGGHILTNVYGGNETTDVMGSCTVNMIGGTIGVPRTEERMKAHPVTCYLFGAGKGDQRTHFNTWTNVQETEVNVSSKARIFGSVFGGGEDGHVLGNAKVNIGGNIDLNGDGDKTDEGEIFPAPCGLKIGTTGTSYVDGNIFGGGRGFSGLALTAGSTGGNTEVNITDGTMLGSVYGGGRLASVGIDFTPADDPSYGQLVDDKEGNPITHGHITVNISGGTIGNDVLGAQYGGNVFGAGMGRNTKLNGDFNELWPKIATSKTTTVNISGGTIKKNVYGGAEYGIVRNQAEVTISGSADIRGSVYGGGKGSDDYQHKTTIEVGGYANLYYSFTPMLWNGAVSGNTIVNVEGGTIGQNVYGGGELASVGLIDFVSDKDGNFTNMPKHESLTDGFGLSWPYEFTYHAAAPNDDAVGGKTIGGKTTVNITGGHIGSTTWDDGTGYVFGGSKGKVEFGITSISDHRYTEAFCANVKETEVNINFATPSGKNSTNIGAEANCIMGAVYGGGEDGHVYDNAEVNITGGLIGLSVYGAGKGISTYKGYLRDGSTDNPDDYKNTTDDLYSWTAGKVYGNTKVTMADGHVLNNIYGGGYLGSVGKGNYAGGSDDYYPVGYGETLNGNTETADKTLWDGGNANSLAFLSSGKAEVVIEGGTVGTLNGTYGTVGGDPSKATPTGIVFGGSRGQAAQDIMLDPRYEYAPNFYLGYVNETKVTIGTESSGGPRIFSQVFGGGRDGHVRSSARVIINDGTIGQTYAESGLAANPDYQRYHRGNVYGSGSGLGLWNSVNHGMSSGSVTNKTRVDINGGTIYNNVYGGGALSSVGPPRIDMEKDYASASISQCVVNINGGTIGQTAVYEDYKYGGCVYGASRGNDFEAGESPDNYATVLWTQVNINGGSIAGNVYGGAKGGIVWKDTEVNMKGGTIAHNAYGGGQGTTDIAANIGGNTTVKLNEGKGADDSGCMVEKVFGCNDLNGTPKGHALVHVYATQHKNTTKIVPDEVGKYAKFESMEGGYSITNYSGLITLAAATGTAVSAYTDVLSGGGTEDEKKTALANMIEAIADKKYDVLAVYGGGDLAMYEPIDPNENTDVIIDGCALTSIKQVYGGGNAASTPANLVRINEAYEIHEAFGGGNGKDDYETGGKWYKNLGANVGYKATFHSDKSGDPTTGTKANPYPAVAYDDADTPEERRANTSYHYGKGTVELNVTGGYVHTTYGGSNMKGNVRKSAITNTEDAGVCTLQIDASYPAGKNADTDGEAKINGSCVDYQEAIYGGSENANVYSDVVIDITNGHYGAIYGGNNTRGKIYGSITINVHEEGCKPIIIDNLYGGGYNADYSIYGYNDDGSARTKTQYDALDASEKAKITVQRDPQINIISATKIGKIYGGGYNAKVIGSPSVNVNMKEGFVTAKYVTKAPSDFSVGNHTVEDHGVDCSYYVERLEDGKAILRRGTVGTVYGGGYKGDVQGDTDVEIGTGEWLSFTGKRETTDADGKVYTYNSETGKWDWTKTDGETTTSGTVDDKPAPARNAATITGNVFGGGEGEALESGTDAFFCKSAMVGVDDDNYPDGATSVIIANGTVGTLEGEEGSQTLKAGTGNVYGGGEIGRVQKSAAVTIGMTPKEGETMDNTKFKPSVYGSVFGGGQGVDTHGFSGLVQGNSTVTIQGFAKVGESVYGGGEFASVGRYNLVDGRPTTSASETSGNCIVAVRDDAEIGPNNMTMFHVNGSGNIVANDQPDNSGHVFGAGKGAMPKADYTEALQMTEDNVMAGFTSEADYLKFIETLGLTTQTEVTIGGNAFVKGDVFGGSEQGFVLYNTHVIIEGDCQIGNGYVQMNAAGEYLPRTGRYSLNRRYTDTEWSDGHLTGVAGYENSLPECASWEYGQATDPDDKYAPHDIYAGTIGYDSKGGRLIADNGSTFYGNVFGGGSGYFPYRAGTWDWKAGDVGGNILVEIKGGHVLTNVYGGNELTNVGRDDDATTGKTTGKCTINMTGGTIGVPRTLGQISAHPVTCYLFGAGKGDPRVLFNKQTNVNDVEINVSGGWIYGSVFGGGEDGHVMRNVAMNISDGAKIGTWGTSYVDGNVFGGGRGFTGEAYTAGNVAGSVTLNITGGTMLGSIYGGGRLGSVGYGLYDEGASGYGEMRADDKMDDGTTAPVGMFPKGRGHVEVTISGGTIGNAHEFAVPTGTGPVSGNAFGSWTDADWTSWKNTNHVPYTEYDTSNGRLTHTKGGNVYAGGMGRYYQLNGTDPITDVDWWKLGNVKSTTLTISGTPWIMSNVYGGGELGAVTPYTDSPTNPTIVQGGTAAISITGGTIGTEVTGGTPEKTTVSWEPTAARTAVQYTFGSVYGGGMGMEDHDEVTKRHGGEVGGNTTVTMSGEDTEVRASVFGGGEMAIVDGNTTVTVSGGKIGRYEVKPLNDLDAGYVLFGGATMGNVYGGGKGILGHTEAGQVKGNTNVTISGGNVYHMVYGGGALGSVGDFKLSKKEGDVYVPSYIPAVNIPYDWTVGTGTATVTITGGVIGISGRDNGLVFGSSRGNLTKPVVDPESDNKLLDPYDKVAWVNKAVVNIGNPETPNNLASPLIKCSVYGGGENGHNDESATVNVYSGTIGVTDTDDPWYNFGTNETVRAKAQLNRGNVYGAGSGSDTYTGDDGSEYWNAKSGMVAGNTFVNIYGGHIGRSVYGGGAMASVGTIMNVADTADVTKDKHKNEATSFALSWPYKFEFQPGTGKATVNVTGGHIGTRQLDGGDVYGSSRGEAGDRYKMAHLAWTNETEVNIKYSETIDMPTESAIQNDFTTQCITGSVHGSGENGYVHGDTRVTLNEGLIGHSLYGAGKGNGTYTKTLNKLPGSGGGTYEAKIYSLIAGKVMGNTEVTMNGGRVGRNVYGGGNMGSVGKGNYSGGADDYYPAGYGETITGNLWTSASEGDNAWEFLHSGKTTVKVLGGVVGYIDATDPSKSMKNQLPYGNVIGGSAGEAAPNIAEDPRYEYSPAFFSGYVNETDVTIGGGYRCTTACTIGGKDYKVDDSVTAAEYNAFTSGQSNWEAIDAPTILASVYGGSQDGHVRRDSKVTVNNGEIGLPYNDENQAILGSLQLGDGSLNPQWLHRGNVYGGGSGITKYKYDFDHDGKTSEDLNGDGIIEDSEIDTGTYHDKTVKDEDYSSSSGSVTRFAEVNILGGTVHRNVYGGGSLGSVGAPKIDQDYDPYKKNLSDLTTLGKQSQNTVSIGGQIGAIVNSRAHYGGDVFGAGRGNPSLNVEEFGTSIWTRVNILNGATIFGNVFGGGDAGAVKKDAEVMIGE